MFTVTLIFPHFRLCLFDLPPNLGVLLSSMGSAKMKLLPSQIGKWHLLGYVPRQQIHKVSSETDLQMGANEVRKEASFVPQSLPSVTLS